MTTRLSRLVPSSMASRFAFALVGVAPIALMPVGTRAGATAVPQATAVLPACSTLPLLANSETTDNAFPGIRSVVVRGGTGDVHVSPSADGTTNVHTMACWGTSNKPTLVQQVQGNVLAITSQCPPSDLLSGLLNTPCRRDISITAPADVALDVAAGTGSVTADGMAGTASLGSGVGDVIATSSRSQQVQVTTGLGNVLIDAVTSPRQATATSGTGGVHVRVPAGSYVIAAGTVLGHVTITGVQQNPGSPNHIVAHSNVGDVQVTAR